MFMPRILSSLLLLFSLAAAQDKDVVFIMDGSGSIDDADWTLQKEGMKAAINNPTYLPADGSVSITIVQFSLTAQLELNTTLVIDDATRNSIIATVDAIVQLNSYTGPGTGILAATDILSTIYRASATQTFCLSTDGPTNRGPTPEAPIQAAKDAVFGLEKFSVIGIEDPDNSVTEVVLDAHYSPATDLGGGSFFITTNTVEFANTVGDLCFGGAVVSPDPTVKLVGLEVTQTSQDLTNSVRVFAQKPTLVRAYFEPTVAGTTISLFKTRLHVYLNGVDMGRLSPTPDSITVQDNAKDRRGVFADSLNFELPANMVAATGPLRLVVEPVGTPFECKEAAGPSIDDCEATVNLDEAQVYRVKYLKLEFDHTSLVSTDADAAEEARRLKAIFPTREIDYTTSVLDCGSITNPTSVATLQALWTQRTVDCSSNSDDCDRMYYGLIHDDIPGSSSGGIAYRPSPVGVGIVERSTQGYLRNVAAHEMGHSVGIQHTANELNGYCNKPLNGAAFPFLSTVNGNVGVATIGPFDQGDDAQVYGWDSLRDVIVDPSQEFELMSYCRGTPNGMQKWISSKTYEEVFTKWKARSLNNFNRKQRKLPQATGNVERRLPQAGDVCIHRAIIDADTNTTTLLDVYCIPGNESPSQSGDFEFVLRDAGGAIISSTSVEALEATVEVFPGQADPILPNIKIASAAIAFAASALKVDLESTGTGAALATATASANNPTVAVTSPTAGQVLSGTSVTFTWTANDDDGDSLKYMLQYSADNGVTFKLLVADLVNDDAVKSYTAQLSDLQGSSNAIIRVTASDGFLTGAGDSLAFTVPDSPPSIQITKPVDSAQFVGVQTIILRASASDLEDGILSGASVVWTSSNPGDNLGTGQGAELSFKASDLAEGTRTFTATVTDSNGGSVTATVDNISVLRLAVSVVSKTCQPTRRNLFWTDVAKEATPTRKNLRATASAESRQLENCMGACVGLQVCELDEASGTHQCACPLGYIWHAQDRMCKSHNECEDLPYPCPGPVDGVESSYCVDAAAPNRYKCGCLSGFEAVLPTEWTDDAAPLEWRPEACIDQDECATDSPCDPNASCTNTVGSYVCACNSGYTGDGFTCAEVVPTASPVDGNVFDGEVDGCDNKCRVEGHQVCAPSVTNPGTHACLCMTGFSQLREGSGCKDDDECDADRPTHNCNAHAQCINLPGTFRCECLDGYNGGGRSCQLNTPAPVTPAPTDPPTTPAPVAPTATAKPVGGGVSLPVCTANGFSCSDDSNCCSGTCS